MPREALAPAVFGTEFSDVDPVVAGQLGEAGEVGDELRCRVVSKTTTLLIARNTLKLTGEIRFGYLSWVWGEVHLSTFRDETVVGVEDDAPALRVAFDRLPGDRSQVDMLCGPWDDVVHKRLGAARPGVPQTIETVGVGQGFHPRHLSAPREPLEERVQVGQAHERRGLGEESVDVILAGHVASVARVAPVTKSTVYAGTWLLGQCEPLARSRRTNGPVVLMRYGPFSQLDLIERQRLVGLFDR